MWHTSCVKKMFRCDPKEQDIFSNINFWPLYLFLRAARTKFHRRGVGWDQTTKYLLIFRKARSPGSRCWQGCFPLRSLCLACRGPAVFFLFLHTVFPSLHVHILIFSLNKDVSHIGLRPTQYDFTLP